jgi:TorA maturation chaperone TorD
VSDAATPSSAVAQVAVGRLLSQLLLREPDVALLGELRAPEVNAGLRELGVEVPTYESDAADRAWLEERGAEYLDRWLRPDRGGPPVQSLWSGGQYEGDPAVALRRWTEAVGLRYDAEAARGAPIDHLGSSLALWCLAAEHSAEHAEALRVQHLEWGRRPLEAVRKAGGFYGGVAGATLEWLDWIGESADGAEPRPGESAG